MTTFDQREQSEERKFAFDEEAEFKARARRDKLVGLWAAGKLGLDGPDAQAYAQSLVATDLEKHGEIDVVAKLKADFAAKKIALSDHQIERTMAEMLAEAKRQLKDA